MEAIAQQTVRLLGPVQVEWVSGEPPRFRSQRTMALLGYLAAARRPVARRALGALLWPDEPAAEGQANLRRELHNLGQILPGCCQADASAVHFAADAQTEVDLDILRRLDEEGHWREAAGWARGEFLEGLELKDNFEFETWLLAERERWRQRAERVLVRAARAAQEGGRPAEAQRFLTRLLQLVPWHEAGHRLLMDLLARTGRFTAALRQYEQCRQVLSEELAVEPTAETTRLAERIRSAQAMPVAHLPAPPSPFVGREADLEAIARLLADPTCRLLTLTGVGGIGKSRLALEVTGRPMVDDYRRFLHGVAFVPLVGVDIQDLTTAVGSALKLALSGQEPAERQLLRYLTDLELLLLLDNYEHLLPETKLLEAILREAPEVKLLVTSRERLGLAEEWLFETEGLPYPPAADEDDGRPLGEYDAVRLFARRAGQVRRDFSLDAAGPAVAEITHLTEGMPLALELAAAWLGSLTPADVAAEVRRGFDFLEAHERNPPERHQSLRAVFRSSWARLSPAEQRALAALSVFRGGFTREAAAEVAGATTAVLSALADRSLIRLARIGRFEMHELLRQYAAEKLAGDKVAGEAIQERYAAYYSKFLALREQRLLETDQERVLGEIEPEMDNIRLAWRWAAERQRVDVLEPGSWPLGFYYGLRGRPIDFLAMTESALAWLVKVDYQESQQARLRARLHLFRGAALQGFGRLKETRAVLEEHLDRLRRWGTPQDVSWALFALGQTLYELNEAGALPCLREALVVARASDRRWLEGFIATRLANFLFLEGDSAAEEESEQLLSQALAVGGQLDNPWVLANAFLVDGRLAEFRGEYHHAVQAFERGLAAARRLDQLWLMGMVLTDLGHARYMQGSFAQARLCYEESGLVLRRMGARKLEAWLLKSMGDLARAIGEREQAVGHYQAGLAIQNELGDDFGRCWIKCSLGHALLLQFQVERAARCFQESLAEPGWRDPQLTGMALAGLAGVQASRGQLERAARLGGAAEARLAATPRRLEPADRQDWDRIQAEVRGRLDDATFAAEWAEGQAMPADAAVALALSLL